MSIIKEYKGFSISIKRVSDTKFNFIIKKGEIDYLFSLYSYYYSCTRHILSMKFYECCICSSDLKNFDLVDINWLYANVKASINNFLYTKRIKERQDKLKEKREAKKKAKEKILLIKKAKKWEI